MKTIKTILFTLICALAILTLGYVGIRYSGELVLKSPEEPEAVTMAGNISRLFYSRLEDDIQLYPWNYYPLEDDTGDTEVEKNMLFSDYSPFVENNVFYTLISVAAGVDVQEVRQWYDKQDKTITGSLKQGAEDDALVEIYFYDDVIRLAGREYRVKLACDTWNIYSFSCIQCRDDSVKDTKDWNQNKEKLIAWMDESDMMQEIFLAVHNLFFNINGSSNWYRYVDMYQFYLELITKINQSEETEKLEAELTEIEKSNQEYMNLAEKYGLLGGENGDGTIQVIELKDCLLLMMEQDVAVGFYYDVIEQKITGFHFFIEKF